MTAKLCGNGKRRTDVEVKVVNVPDVKVSRKVIVVRTGTVVWKV